MKWLNWFKKRKESYDFHPIPEAQIADTEHRDSFNKDDTVFYKGRKWNVDLIISGRNMAYADLYLTAIPDGYVSITTVAHSYAVKPVIRCNP